MIGMTETIGVDDFDDPATPLDLDSEQALDALERLAGHLPPDVDLGRPMFARYVPADHSTQFVTRHGLFSVYSASADRLASIGGSHWAELTEWAGKAETSRTTRRISDLRPQPGVGSHG